MINSLTRLIESDCQMFLLHHGARKGQSATYMQSFGLLYSLVNTDCPFRVFI